MSTPEYQRLHKLVRENMAQFEVLKSMDTANDFLVWLLDNMHLYERFKMYALYLKRNGNRATYGSRCIVERIRWDTMLRENSLSGYKINNNATPYLSRLAMLDHGEIAGMFSTRECDPFGGIL